jgi:hypothetical protein
LGSVPTTIHILKEMVKRDGAKSGLDIEVSFFVFTMIELRQTGVWGFVFSG